MFVSLQVLETLPFKSQRTKKEKIAPHLKSNMEYVILPEDNTVVLSRRYCQSVFGIIHLERQRSQEPTQAGGRGLLFPIMQLRQNLHATLYD